MMDSTLQRWQPRTSKDLTNSLEGYYAHGTSGGGPLDDVNGPNTKCLWTFSYPQLDPPDLSEVEKSARTAQLASALLSDACESPSSHDVDMNRRLARHIVCRYSKNWSSWQFIYKANGLLSRLPRVPPIPYFVPFNHPDNYDHQLTAEYFVPGHDMRQNSRRQFGDFANLRVVSAMDGITTQLALLVADAQGGQYGAPYMGFQIRSCIDQLARTLDAVLVISETGSHLDSVTGQGLKVVVALLWTVWQRSVTLYLAWVLDFEIRAGPSADDFLVLQYPRLLSEPATLKQWAGQGERLSAYMCPWALQLLQTSKASLAFDYRTLKCRFQEAHESRPARCTSDHQPCEGTSPTACGRFTDLALRIPDQDMHSGCKGCSKILWDERSYRKVRGARAVDVRKTSSRVRYCQAGEDTLAISHVWAHGQGGRPDKGMNRCLHERYCRLAKSQGCDSYWIDTLCIPDAHDLRKEAINNINETFSSSKLTLVCDRDLMAITNKSGWEDVAVAERLLATLLVCDWNVRAWTMFESIRGRKNLHILCADDRIVSVKSLVQIVLSSGATDLAVIALASKHTLPRNGYRQPSVSESSSLLSHRHATRSGDDILIWSLMCGGRSDQHTSDPERFWTSSVGRFVNTGYLLSTAPRLNAKYFRWAPRSPNVRFEEAARSHKYVFSSDGEGSEVGRVTARGLDATWLVHPVWPWETQRAPARTSAGPSVRDESIRAEQALAREERSDRFPRRRHAGWINPCFEALDSLRTQHRRLCILKAKATIRGEYQGAEELKRVDGMVALAYSDHAQPQPAGDVEDQWIWAGTYEWPHEAEMPEGDWARILLQ